MLRFLGILLGGVLLLLAVVAVGLKVRYGGGEAFPDRTTAPLMDIRGVETVAETAHPPGNIAVAADGRVFFTLHPEGRPPVNVVQWVDGRAVPWPSAEFQPGGSHELAFQEILSLRIDRQARLWVLDNAMHGLGQPRLLAFDLDTGEVVYRHDFTRAMMGRGSHANDFQVDSEGRFVYIADASFFALTPALVVHDTVTGNTRRLLEGDISVQAEKYVPVVAGRRMEVLGLVAVRPGVDSIALDKQDEWLYFAAVTAGRLYRVRTEDLRDTTLDAVELSRSVEAFAEKTMSDGITMDLEGNIYVSDPEHSAILRIGQDREMVTLLRDPRIRWPDGFSFGPGGWLYFTCSSLHQVIGMLPSSLRDNAPYQVYRFRPGVSGVPGH